VGREDGPALELLDGEVGVEGHELVLRQELVEECVGVGEEVVVGFFVGECVGVGEVLDGREGRLDEAPGGLDVHEVPQAAGVDFFAWFEGDGFPEAAQAVVVDAGEAAQAREDCVGGLDSEVVVDHEQGTGVVAA